jgi:hypothetical protein
MSTSWNVDHYNRLVNDEAQRDRVAKAQSGKDNHPFALCALLLQLLHDDIFNGGAAVAYRQVAV